MRFAMHRPDLTRCSVHRKVLCLKGLYGYSVSPLEFYQLDNRPVNGGSRLCASWAWRAMVA